MEEICPGHPLDPGMLDRARREFDLMGKHGFLDAANRIAGMAEELVSNPYEILGRGSPESRAYADAIRAREWESQHDMPRSVQNLGSRQVS